MQNQNLNKSVNELYSDHKPISLVEWSLQQSEIEGYNAHGELEIKEMLKNAVTLFDCAKEFDTCTTEITAADYIEKIYDFYFGKNAFQKQLAASSKPQQELIKSTAMKSNSIIQRPPEKKKQETTRTEISTSSVSISGETPDINAAIAEENKRVFAEPTPKPKTERKEGFFSFLSSNEAIIHPV